MQDSTLPASLLAEVAPILDLEALVQHEDDNGVSWDLMFNEELLVEAFLDKSGDKLVLTTHVGTPTDERASQLHKLLLQYNYLWRDTSGTRMALEPPEGNVIMMYDLALAGLDGVELRNVLQNFAAAAKAWALLIAGSQTSDDAAPLEGSDDTPFDPALFIRV
ncbi:type III secretion system chaperone [Verrucomicrobium sp. BvORR106]|uniref:type III secretion system chaperone n=1 Tax=Verrucomicrobium sp. BvORR106 TaxID=1403819 RepID=UPI00056E4146|nr:type III secretion system chaperone [Verrucomicrobium sp. BvORR106]